MIKNFVALSPHTHTHAYRFSEWEGVKKIQQTKHVLSKDALLKIHFEREPWQVPRAAQQWLAPPPFSAAKTDPIAGGRVSRRSAGAFIWPPRLQQFGSVSALVGRDRSWGLGVCVIAAAAAAAAAAATATAAVESAGKTFPNISVGLLFFIPAYDVVLLVQLCVSRSPTNTATESGMYHTNTFIFFFDFGFFISIFVFFFLSSLSENLLST